MRFPHLAPDWLSGYSGAHFSSDLVASVIVTIMLIPQSLAYAMLAGLPAQMGLYASILPLAGYALFGSSRTLAVGPVAVISLMTAAAVSELAEPGSADYAAIAILLALLSGLFLFGLGLLRLGFLANLLSQPVITGFISATAVLIAVSQLKHILGISVQGHTLVTVLGDLAAGLDRANPPTFVIGALSITFLFWVRTGLKPLLERFGLPSRAADLTAKAGPVAAVIVSIAAVSLLGLDQAGVEIVGDVPQGLPPFTFPAFDAGLWSGLLPAAALISIVGFIESVSVARSLAAKRRQSIDANRELLGLGSANVAAAVTGGYPVTGGFARSVVNFAAGAQTPLAGVLTAGFIAVTALLFTPLFFFLPNAVLAATIIVAVLSLVDVTAMKECWSYSKSDFAALAATVAVTLAVGIEAGITAGVGLSVLLLLWQTGRPHFAIVGQVPGSEHFRNIERHRVVTAPHVLTLRADESLQFANAKWLEERVAEQVAVRPEVTHVVLMCPAVNHIDASALQSLELIADRLKAGGVTLHLSEVKGPVMDRLKRSHFFDHLTGEVFLSQYDAFKTLAPDAAARAGTKSRAGAPAAG